MGAGGIIHQRAAIKAAVLDPSIYGVLSGPHQTIVDSITAKGLADWTVAETLTMVSMLTIATTC